MSSLFRKEALEHQRTKLWGDVIIVQPTSYYLIVAVFLIVFIAAGVFLASQSYARKESVQGFLAPEGGLANVYASRGGVIETVYVEAGSKVEKGDTLVSLKLDRRLPSGVSSSDAYIASLKRELSETEDRFNVSDIRFEKQRTSLEARRKSQQAEQAAMLEEQAILTGRIQLAEKQYRAALELAEQGFATQRTVDARQEALLGLKQQHTSLKRQLTALEASISQTESNIELLPFRFDEETSNLRQRKEVLERQISEQAFSAAYVLTAPIDGFVTSILKSAGATAQANVPLIVIRPDTSELVAKLLVPSRAAGLLKVGQDAKIQYDAFPYQRFGVFNGTVESISETIVAPGEIQVPVPMHEAFYLVDLSLASNAISVSDKDVNLKPGMLLKADIKLEQRSLIEWVFDPILSLRGTL